LKWSIEINDFLGGYAPGYYLSTYPSYGNKNMAGAMQNVNLIDPAFITQGPGLTALTTGPTTLIKGLLDFAQASNLTFGVGGNLFYELSATAVSVKESAPVLPHVISHDGSELAEDVAYYQGAIYYTYNQAGAVGDIGKYDLTRDADADFDDDWGSTFATGGAALTSNPHPLCVGGNDFLYWGDGARVGSFDGTTFIGTDLDLPTNSVVSSLVWTANQLWIATNRPNITGANKPIGSVYVWNGVDTSWDEEIRVAGRISALYVKGGIIYVFYEDLSGYYKIGYINGNYVQELATFSGGLPAYYQVTEYKNFLIFNSNGLIFAYGSISPKFPAMLFQLADGGYTTVGCVKNPFGIPLIASTVTTSYQIAYFNGYDTACNWKTLLFDVSGDGKESQIDKIKFNFEVLVTNAKVDWTIRNNKGTAKSTGAISYSVDGAVTQKIVRPSCTCENFRLELDWTNGNATNDLRIKNVVIYGHTLQ